MKKRILIYGDSNVWGYQPGGERLLEEEQWVNIVQQQLGLSYDIIQAGLPARTAGNLEPQKTYLNGQDMFEATVRSAMPLDLVLISLGTNDLKSGYQRTPRDIVNDLLWYTAAIKSIDETLARSVVYILPPNFIYREGGMSEDVRRDVIAQMRHILPERHYIVPDTLSISKDGVHLSRAGHAEMAEIVYEFLSELYAEKD